MTDKQFAITLKRTARLPAAVAVLVIAVILFGAFNLIESILPLGFTTTHDLSSGDYSAQNHIFEEYAPSFNVTLEFYNKKSLVNTSAVTVGEFLEKQGIYVDSNDKVSESLDTMLEEDMHLTVDKIDEYTIEITETTEYHTVVNRIRTIPVNTRELVSEGNNGVVNKTIKQYYENGELVNEELISSEVIEELKPRVENLGVGGVYYAADGKSYRYSYYIDVLATGYGGEIFSGYTFTGKQVEIGMIAVDPNTIPLRSRCYVVNEEGDLDFGVCYAEDTGSKIIGNRIDIFFGGDAEGEERARMFGRKNVRVYVLVG